MRPNIETFIGCDKEYESSSIILFGAPFDSTTSFRPGTRFASKAIRSESYGLETYSPYQDKDLVDMNVCDCGDLELPFGNPSRALGHIEEYIDRILKDDKMPGMIGGEHLVTLGGVRAAIKRYPNLHIVHFDAHTDLRDSYLDESLSHASVIRRCHELVGNHRIHQFGIRSGEREEFLWAKEHVYLHPFGFTGLEESIESIGDSPVYLTIDLDVLDPSIFPGTGTPEAGGVSFIQLLEAILKVSKLNIVAFDINELSPIYDQSGVSTAVACKILRETLLAIKKEDFSWEER